MSKQRSTESQGSRGKAKDGLPCTAAVDPTYYNYLLQHIGETNVQQGLREASEKKEWSGMMATADEYQFLAWFAATMQAKKVIEVGVFRGVTTLAMALQLPDDARIVALDINEDFCEAGKRAWKEAGVDHKIEFITGPAADSMRKLLEKPNEAGTYDFIFIDADKSNYMQYYELALKLVRVGGVIAVDNALFHGRALGPVVADDDEEMATLPEDVKEYMPIRQLNKLLTNDSRVSAVMNVTADGIYFVRRLV